MQELYEGLELNEAQTAYICRGLMDLAAVDGVHESEVELIHQFYETAGGEPAKLKEAFKAPFELAEGKTLLAEEAEKEAFLLSCYLLIYADGEHSEPEQARIAEFGQGLEVTEAKMEELHTKARLYLLRMLAEGLKNRDIVRQVGAAMGLDDANIDSVMEG